MAFNLETLRKPKVFDIVVFDTVATLFGAIILWAIVYAITKKTEKNNDPKWVMGPYWIPHFIVLVFLLGIFAHRISKRSTKLNYYLGLGPDPRPAVAKN